MKVDIYFDASCDNGSKLRYMGVGVAVYIDGDYAEAFSHSSMVGTNGTNNIAEWEALKKALEISLDLVKVYGNPEITIFGDSQLVVRQFNGVYRIRKPHLAPYFRECRLMSLQLETALKDVLWVRREGNTKADELSKTGVTDFLKNYL